ncbi:MAG: response regulator [Terracidiphilus sp.]|jgi:CheY-like chemotaxis protein
MTEPVLDLLVVDDDDLTAESLQRSLKKISSVFHVVPAEDGQEALDILFGRSMKRIERPFIVLLDLNMPRMNGFEFLKELRADERFRGSVVFVLSSSDADLDIYRAYDQCVAGYMVKTIVGSQFSQIAKMLIEYSETIRFGEATPRPVSQ